jgi:hypothetical protein
MCARCRLSSEKAPRPEIFLAKCPRATMVASVVSSGAVHREARRSPRRSGHWRLVWVRAGSLTRPTSATEGLPVSDLWRLARRLGAEPYEYTVPYEPDIQAALDKLRSRVFEHHSRFDELLELLFLLCGLPPNAGPIRSSCATGEPTLRRRSSHDARIRVGHTTPSRHSTSACSFVRPFVVESHARNGRKLGT